MLKTAQILQLLVFILPFKVLYAQTKREYLKPEYSFQFNYYQFLSNKHFFGVSGGCLLSNNQYLTNYSTGNREPGFNSAFLEAFYNASLDEGEKWHLFIKAHLREGKDVNFLTSKEFKSYQFVNPAAIHIGKLGSKGQIILEAGANIILLPGGNLFDKYTKIGIAQKLSIAKHQFRLSSSLESHWLTFGSEENVYTLRGDNLLETIDQTKLRFEMSTFISKTVNIKLGHTFFTEYYNSANQFYNKLNVIRSVFNFELCHYVSKGEQKNYSYLF